MEQTAKEAQGQVLHSNVFRLSPDFRKIKVVELGSDSNFLLRRLQSKPGQLQGWIGAGDFSGLPRKGREIRVRRPHKTKHPTGRVRGSRFKPATPSRFIDR